MCDNSCTKATLLVDQLGKQVCIRIIHKCDLTVLGTVTYGVNTALRLADRITDTERSVESV